MPAEPSNLDPRILWRDQQQEADAMTLEQIHALARRLDRKTRHILPIGLAVVAASGFIAGQQWLTFHEPLRRLGIALTEAGLLTTFVLTYRRLNPRRDPAESGGRFLRRQLQGLLANARGGWMITLSPLLPGVAVTVVAMMRDTPGFGPAQAAPLVLMAAALLFVARRAPRRARQLEQEIAALDALLKT